MTVDEFENPLYMKQSSPAVIDFVTAADNEPNQPHGVEIHTVVADVHAIQSCPEQSDVDANLIHFDDKPDIIYTIL